MRQEDYIRTQSDTYLDSKGQEHIRCRWKTSNPLFINISRPTWTARHLGTQHTLNWDTINLSPQLLMASKEVIKKKLKKHSPGYLGMARNLLNKLQQIEALQTSDFSNISLTQTHKIMQSLPLDKQSTFREWYTDWAKNKEAGANPDIAHSLQDTRITRHRNQHEFVRQWHPTKGALTTSELEVLRQRVEDTTQDKTVYEHFCRLFLRTCLSLGKRPSQILSITQDGIISMDHDSEWSHCLRIPGIKHQTNEDTTDWPISPSLHQDIKDYSKCEGVAEAQEHFGHLFVTPLRKDSRKEGMISIAKVEALLTIWFKHNAPISPRTKEPLVVTPTRLRHTLATQMVKKGYHLDDVRSLLEHKGKRAVQSYVDAVGSDLAPALERVNTRLGGVFSDISDAFFKGRISSSSESAALPPILVPDVKQPAVVGACGLGKPCPKTPFFACYDGCPNFVAFREGDHHKSLAFLEAEENRWAASEHSKTNSKIRSDIARMAKAVQDVLGLIEQGKERPS